MNKINLIYTVIILAFFASCSTNKSINQKKMDTTTVTNTLNKEELKDLLVLREEEKLARDVYLYAYDKYGTQIFKNISGSEEKHMNQVLRILEANGIADPAKQSRGDFNNPEMQKLYNTLTAKASLSLTDALKVGATIEDLDIYDIESFKLRTSNSEILAMYDKLACGSRNHMRAFIKQLDNQGTSYIPVYISVTDFQTILNSQSGPCGKGKGRGQGHGMGKGKGHGNGQGRGKNNSW